MIGMTKIEAIIEPSKLQPAIDALVEFGFEGLTVENVRTTAESSNDASVTYRGAPGASFVFLKQKIEMVVRDDEAEDAVRIISQAARTGHMKDGIIFVSAVAEVIRIRNGQCNEAAL